MNKLQATRAFKKDENEDPPPPVTTKTNHIAQGAQRGQRVARGFQRTRASFAVAGQARCGARAAVRPGWSLYAVGVRSMRGIKPTLLCDRQDTQSAGAGGGGAAFSDSVFVLLVRKAKQVFHKIEGKTKQKRHRCRVCLSLRVVRLMKRWHGVLSSRMLPRGLHTPRPRGRAVYNPATCSRHHHSTHCQHYSVP